MYLPNKLTIMSKTEIIKIRKLKEIISKRNPHAIAPKKDPIWTTVCITLEAKCDVMYPCKTSLVFADSSVDKVTKDKYPIEIELIINPITVSEYLKIDIIKRIKKIKIRRLYKLRISETEYDEINPVLLSKNGTIIPIDNVTPKKIEDPVTLKELHILLRSKTISEKYSNISIL